MTTCVSRPPWTDKYKQNWDDAYPRLMAWWEGASLDRPIVINSVAKPDAPPFDGPKSIPEMEKADLDADYRRRCTHMA